MIEKDERLRLSGAVVRRRGRMILLADRELVDAVIEMGLLDPRTKLAPCAPGTRSGRGARGIVPFPDGRQYLVKESLRGGFPAHFNRDRFFATRRFHKELHAACVAVARGIAVAPTVAVILESARPGYRAWTVSLYLDGCRDLAQLFGSGALGRDEAAALYAAALRAIRSLHQAGIRHRDLNLGNLVARRREHGDWEVHVIDLDRAEAKSEPVPLRLRRRARARFERSWRKLFDRGGALSETERTAIRDDIGP